MAGSVQGDVRPLPPATQIALYRIGQEGLNNVVKLAQAGAPRSSSVRLSGGGVRLRLDDGRGFDTTTIRSGHLGVSIMRERAEAVGAHFQLTSTPDRGTAIEVDWQTMEASSR